MAKKGFTLIELLVVIVIIGILVAIALPNFIKIKDKAKEAEIKQNLHSVQLAIERYQVDSGSTYPFFLYGGDPAVNMGTTWAVYGNNSWMTSNSLKKHPFDMFWLNTNTWHYASTNWNALLDGTAGAAFGDTLQYEGYMPKYPRNPFQGGQGKRPYDLSLITTSRPFFCGWGGRDGSLMWNLNPWGQGIFENFYMVTPIYLEFPGNFFYHPRYSDGATNWGHLFQQAPYNTPQMNSLPFGIFLPPLNDGAPTAGNTTGDIASEEIAGYDLVAVGSVRTKGQDLDVSIMNGTEHEARTGYFVLGQERNPWIQTGDVRYPGIQNYQERPFGDSIQDFIIIHLGSGLDKKIYDPNSAQ